MFGLVYVFSSLACNNGNANPQFTSDLDFSGSHSLSATEPVLHAWSFGLLLHHGYQQLVISS